MELTTKAEPILCELKELGGFCVSSFSTLATNTIMNEYFIGIDIQTKRDCSYAISDQNGDLKESGWFSENHSILNTLKKLSVNAKLYVGIDAPRMALISPRQWYWVGSKKKWRPKTKKHKGHGRHCEIVVSAHKLANPQWTPFFDDAPAWMKKGFALFKELGTFFPTFEVFPTASYSLLSGVKEVKLDIDFSNCLPGPKDMMDAFVASVTVREFTRGKGIEVGNGDGLGAIILPRPLPEPLLSEVLTWP
jgi:predicted nuclease with RNAse H fold